MQEKKLWWKNGVWLLAAGLQMVFLWGVSLRAGGTTLDNDAGKVYTHMMAIWESGTLAVPDWKYITTMELDCTTILALPFYGLTHNPILAFWCGNVLLLALWGGLLYGLVRRLGGSPARAALALLLVLLPYELYMTGYWNMLFLNAAQYAFKVMLPLLLILLLLAPARPRRRDWGLLAVYLAGCWLTAFSSGIYVAACGLAPVVCLAVYGWLKGRTPITPYRAAALAGSVVTTLLGMALQKALGVETAASSMNLNSIETIRDNAVNCVIAFFRLFGGVPKELTPVFSAAGLSVLLRLGLAAGVLAVGLWFTLCALRGTLPAALRPAGYLAGIFWWNLAVLLLTNTRYGDPYFEYRYHLMGAVPLLVLAALAAPSLVSGPVRLHRAAAAGGTAAVLALVLAVDAGAVGSIWAADGTLGVNGPEREICGLVGTLDVEDVLVAGDSGAAEICGALDPTRRYITLMGTDLQGQILFTWDGRLTDTDGVSYTGPAAVVCPADQGLDALPVYLAAQCEEVGRTTEHVVYRTTGAPLVDGPVGLPYGETAVDYPDSAWYTYAGTVDETRRLHTDPAGGEVMRSAALPMHTATRITLTCESEGSGEAGRLQLWQGDALLAETAVPAGQAQVSLDAPAGEGAYLVLETDPGVSATVGPLYFEALS